MNGLIALTVWKSDLRHFIVLFNILAILAIGGYLLWSVFTRKRVEKSPANETKFLSDDDLEGPPARTRARVEPGVRHDVRGRDARVPRARADRVRTSPISYFEDGSVERGAALFANSASEDYNSVLSLQCANCHGSEGGGGSTTQVIDPDGPDGPLPPEQFVWKAPALNTELLRFSAEEVEQIITYGRPGTPMQAFGVAGGGAENEQTIEDLVAFIQSIQLTPEEAQEEAVAALGEAQAAPAAQLTDGARSASTTATTALNEAQAAVTTAFGVPATTPVDELRTDCDDLAAQLAAAGRVERTGSRRGRGVPHLPHRGRRLRRTRRKRWRGRRRGRRRARTSPTASSCSRPYCARCHTQGLVDLRPRRSRTARACSAWPVAVAVRAAASASTSATARPSGVSVPVATKGTIGFDAQVEFIKTGSEANKQYGNGGVGSGRMPGFSAMLTDEMIDEIVAYERNDLNDTTYLPPLDDDNGCAAPRPRRRGVEHEPHHGARPARGRRDEPVGSRRSSVCSSRSRRSACSAARSTCCSAPTSVRRLGFLVAGACLTGFMVLLSSLWITTATPLNSPKGRPAGWEVKEVVDSPADASVAEAREIVENGDPVEAEGLALLRPAIDGALVTAAPEGAEEPPEQPFAEFGRSTDFLTDFEGFQTFTVGGGTRNLLWHNAAVRGRRDLQRAPADRGGRSAAARLRRATRSRPSATW